MSHAWMQLRGAVTALIGSESQRERLIGAYLALNWLRLKDVPAESRPLFEKILHGVPLRCKDDAQQIARHKVNRFSDSEVNMMMTQIVEAYDNIARYQPLIDSFDRNWAESQRGQILQCGMQNGGGDLA